METLASLLAYEELPNSSAALLLNIFTSTDWLVSVTFVSKVTVTFSVMFPRLMDRYLLLLEYEISTPDTGFTPPSPIF